MVQNLFFNVLFVIFVNENLFLPLYLPLMVNCILIQLLKLDTQYFVQ